ncbi:hypothetical protein RA265_27635, partial [Pseudomonas syringae pv. tagetis]|uniref:hypothetical protein n=1 Tax=Pseudomonas syringae group genomosp. 7 TaxID=251699 RepID=UPI00376F82D0
RYLLDELHQRGGGGVGFMGRGRTGDEKIEEGTAGRGGFWCVVGVWGGVVGVRGWWGCGAFVVVVGVGFVCFCVVVVVWGLVWWFCVWVCCCWVVVLLLWLVLWCLLLCCLWVGRWLCGGVWVLCFFVWGLLGWVGGCLWGVWCWLVLLFLVFLCWL